MLKRTGFKRKPRADWPEESLRAVCFPLEPTRRRIKQAAHRLSSVNRTADQAWARAVKERDGNQCQFNLDGPCASGDRRLDAHHIALRSRRPDLRLTLSNGITFCRTHHEWCHRNPLEAEAMGWLSSRTRELAMKEGTLGIY